MGVGVGVCLCVRTKMAVEAEKMVVEAEKRSSRQGY